jgi:mono/diheme cytochrome c family protein
MRIMTSFSNLAPLRAAIGLALLVSPLVASSQSSPTDVVTRGANVFATSCSFCHGDAGSGHNAPRLADRGLDGKHITKVIADGVSGTAMAAWGKILNAEDYDSVVAYVKNLNGIAASESAAPLPALSAEVVKGRDLFRDATRALGACSNCHAVDGRGVNIVPAMKQLPSGAAALRSLTALQVKTATVEGEIFPAMVATQSPDETKLYDFTTVPPVLRTFPTAALKISDGSTWHHAAVLGATYSDQELDLVLGYLRAVRKP